MTDDHDQRDPEQVRIDERRAELPELPEQVDEMLARRAQEEDAEFDWQEHGQ